MALQNTYNILLKNKTYDNVYVVVGIANLSLTAMASPPTTRKHRIHRIYKTDYLKILVT